MSVLKKVKVVQPPEGDGVSTEILAESIKTIAEGMRALTSGRLNQRALLVLIKDACTTKVTMAEIKAIILAIESLDRMYLRK